MTSTQGNAKAGGWLANYYLRGLIALVALVLTAVVGPKIPFLPVIVALVVWFGLWTANRIRQNS